MEGKFGSTRFNKIVGRKLKTLLDDLENQRLGEVEVSEEMHAVTLREVMSSSDMYGHPLNMTFTEIDDVIQRVKNTDIHLMQRDNIQFCERRSISVRLRRQLGVGVRRSAQLAKIYLLKNQMRVFKALIYSFVYIFL